MRRQGQTTLIASHFHYDLSIYWSTKVERLEVDKDIFNQGDLISHYGVNKIYAAKKDTLEMIDV